MEASDLYNLFQKRQSDRKFDLSRPVDQSIIERIVEASRMAPSACNAQPWEVVLITHPEQSRTVGEIATKGVIGLNSFVRTAPVHILIISKRANLTSRIGQAIRKIDFTPYDVGLFMGHITLAATAEGLGSCIIGMLNGKELQKYLGIPEEKRILFDIVLGYSQDPLRKKKRMDPNDFIHWQKW